MMSWIRKIFFCVFVGKKMSDKAPSEVFRLRFDENRFTIFMKTKLKHTVNFLQILLVTTTYMEAQPSRRSC